MDEMRRGDELGREDAEIAALLEEGRARLAPHDLDRVRSRVFGGSPAPSRFASILAVGVLSLGVAATGAGATVGAAKLAQGDDAAEIQYGDDEEDEGVIDEGGGGRDEGAPGPSGPGAGPPDDLRVPDQLARADSGSLPFTGYLVLPLLGVGMLLTALGVTLLRRLRVG